MPSELSRYHQSDLLREAERERLVSAAMAQNHERLEAKAQEALAQLKAAAAPLVGQGRPRRSWVARLGLRLGLLTV